MARQFSKVKEVVAGWNQVRQYLRSGDNGNLVPVVIPRDKRNFRPIFFLGAAIFFAFTALRAGNAEFGSLAQFFAAWAAVVMLVLMAIGIRRQLLVEIEEGTTGVLSSWGEIVRTLPPGRQIIWQPWQKVEYIVDTATEIPYTAPF